LNWIVCHRGNIQTTAETNVLYKSIPQSRRFVKSFMVFLGEKEERNKIQNICRFRLDFYRRRRYNSIKDLEY